MTLSKKSVQALNFTDVALQRQFGSIMEQLGDVSASEILDGRLVTSVVPASGVMKLAHGLNRRWRGVIVVSSNANYRAPFGSPDVSDSAVYATLTFPVGAGATVTFWIF